MVDLPANAQRDLSKAMAHFKTRPAQFRHIYPVSTICMHGSPLSRHDNRDLWKTYDYRDFGIIGEPYFDVDFGQVLYLTDTGWRWDGSSVSIRDKVRGQRTEDGTEEEDGGRPPASPSCRLYELEAGGAYPPACKPYSPTRRLSEPEVGQEAAPEG
ncbi:MAG: hypothetical protein U5L00_11205 [Desulfovermiculus sp.]|nr:hypothetical protein [Desulfovermiculus sp.]